MAKTYIVQSGDQEIEVQLEEISSNQLKVTQGDEEWILDIKPTMSHRYSVVHENQSYDIRFFHHDERHVDAFWGGDHASFEVEDKRAKVMRELREQSGAGGGAGGDQIQAMMPGKVVAVKVKEGDEVKEGQSCVVLEAMKMENELSSPRDGIIKEVKVDAGASVESGTVLVTLE